MKMKGHLLEGAKVFVLFGAITLIVWSMPDDEKGHAKDSFGDSQIVPQKDTAR